LEMIRKKLPFFADDLAKLIDGIKDYENAEAGQNPEKSEKSSDGDLITLLHKLEDALQSQKAESIDMVLDELGEMQHDSKIKNMLDQISDDVLMAEYGKALENVKKIYN